MADISVIILTYNEELHIERCIEKVSNLVEQIYVVDSFSTDRTVEIAEKLGAIVVQNPFVNQAVQFNWALKHLPISTEWVLRLDADEYLYPELKKEIQTKLPNLSNNVSGVLFKRRHIFLGKWIKRGTYPVTLLRLFRRGKAECELRLMDEHIKLLEGKSIEFDNDFVDHNLNTLSWWTQKHNAYASREAVELIDLKFNLREIKLDTNNLTTQAQTKRNKKLKYAKKPLFWRAFAYFVYRYFLKGGFLEGKQGFLWHFLQGWWYRTLVDAKVWEIINECGSDKHKIKAYIKQCYNIEI